MLAYTLVVGKEGRRIPERTRAELSGIRPYGQALDDAQRLVWMNQQETVALRVWQTGREAFDIGTRWHCDEAGVTAIAGLPILRQRLWRNDTSWAAQIA